MQYLCTRGNSSFTAAECWIKNEHISVVYILSWISLTVYSDLPWALFFFFDLLPLIFRVHFNLPLNKNIDIFIEKKSPMLISIFLSIKISIFWACTLFIDKNINILSLRSFFWAHALFIYKNIDILSAYSFFWVHALFINKNIKKISIKISIKILNV